MIVGLIVFGLVLGASAINGTIFSSKDGGPGLGVQINYDLFGKEGHQGFLVWAISILILASIFKISHMPGTGKAFLTLIFIVFLMKNEGLLNSVVDQVSSIQAPEVKASGSTR